MTHTESPMVTKAIREMNDAIKKPHTIKKALAALKALTKKHAAVLIVILVAIAAVMFKIKVRRAQAITVKIIEITGVTLGPIKVNAEPSGPSATTTQTQTFVRDTWKDIVQPENVVRMPPKGGIKTPKVNMTEFVETLGTAIPDVAQTLSSLFAPYWRIILAGFVAAGFWRKDDPVQDGPVQDDPDQGRVQGPFISQRALNAHRRLVRIQNAYPESTRMVGRQHNLEESHRRILDTPPESATEQLARIQNAYPESTRMVGRRHNLEESHRHILESPASRTTSRTSSVISRLQINNNTPVIYSPNVFGDDTARDPRILESPDYSRLDSRSPSHQSLDFRPASRSPSRSPSRAPSRTSSIGRNNTRGSNNTAEYAEYAQYLRNLIRLRNNLPEPGNSWIPPPRRIM